METDLKALEYDVKQLDEEAARSGRVSAAGKNVLQAVADLPQLLKDIEAGKGELQQILQAVTTEAAKLGDIRGETATETRRRDTVKAEADAQERRLQAIQREIATIKDKVMA